MSFIILWLLLVGSFTWLIIAIGWWSILVILPVSWAIGWYFWMYLHTWVYRDAGGPNEVPLWRYLFREIAAKLRQEGQ